ncbi:MAG: 50S ribosomal protein L11 methyltransferase [Bacteroidaceae bacterium]|nr:50S ribosomal protein L11 methyltransferase [Bacteroidaceae bacterium]
MLYLYADITITPYSEVTCDVLTALLGEIGFDSFEMTETGIKAYIPKEQFDEASLQATLDDLFIPDVTCTYTLHDLENKDWNAEWEQNSFDPILEREFGIRLNPRMAFGSGSHETTYQITSFLLQQDFTSQRVLDMGTGTGVLGIAMAMRGAREVVAIDIDEFSVANARENFALNNINNVHVKLGDASAIEGKFLTIVANIHKNILTADLPTYVQHLAPHGILILSGFFTDDVPEMTKAAQQHNLTVTQTLQRNNWAVLILKQI